MSDLTEQDVAVLDALLANYYEYVYRPEVENAYRQFRNARTRQALKDQARRKWYERPLFDPDNPPEVVDLLNIEPSRKKFEALLADDNMRVFLRLFERADLHWNEALAKSDGRLAAVRKVLEQWAAEEFQTAIVPASSIQFDPVIADALPSGQGYVGPRSGFEAAVQSERVARALRTLSNIAGGIFGAVGYIVGGDEGSDIGAGLDQLLSPRGRRARAARRNSGRKATSSKAVASRGTGAKAVGAKGTETPGIKALPPRTQAPKTGKQPATKPAPQKQPERRSSDERAAARASSAAAAKEGKKLTPSVRAKLEHNKVDVDDAYTQKKINEIFTTNRSDNAPLSHARANSGELRGLLREGRYPNVKRVRFLEPGRKKDDRTPDIEVTMNDGTKKFVEVRTVTGAPRGSKVKDAKNARADISAEFEKSVEDKLRRGQISETNPGKVLFHAPFKPITKTGLEGWGEMLGRIRTKGPLPKGLERIEVTGAPDTDGTTHMLSFSGPKWTGTLIK